MEAPRPRRPHPRGLTPTQLNYRQRRGSIVNDLHLPHKRTDLFEAEQARCTFARTHGMAQLGEYMLTAQGVRTAKEVARGQIDASEKEDIIRQIASIIGPYQAAAKKLDLKKRLRYYAICHHPKAFIKAAQISGLWAKIKRNKIRTFYP